MPERHSHMVGRAHVGTGEQAHEWAFRLQDAIALEDDAGRPVVLTVTGPLTAHGQRLADSLGVQVRVVTATAAMTTCPVKTCGWTFVASDGEDTTPWLEAHLKLMHASTHRNGTVLQEREPETREEAVAADPPPAAVAERDVVVVSESGGSQPGEADPVSRSSSTGRPPGRPPGTWTAETFLQAINDWADLHDGKPPYSTAWAKRCAPWPANSYAYKFFGSWDAAIEAAGFDPKTRARRPSGGAVGDSAITGSASARSLVKENDGPSVTPPPLPVQPHPEAATSEEREPERVGPDDSRSSNVIATLAFDQLIAAGHAMEAFARAMQPLDKPARLDVWDFLKPLIEEALDGE